MADEESDSDYEPPTISALANNLGTSSTDPEFDSNAEHAHKEFSALKRPRKANILMAMARRPELEKQGLSPGEIGALRRTAAVVSRAMTFPAGKNLGKAWSSLKPEQKEHWEQMADGDRRRYVTEVLFYLDGYLGACSSSSWIFPCTGCRSGSETPFMVRLDAGAIEAMLSGQARSDTGYEPVVQIINATEILRSDGSGGGRCAPNALPSPPARAPTRTRAGSASASPTARGTRRRCRRRSSAPS